MNRRMVELGASLISGTIFAYLLVEAWGYRGQSSYMPVATTGLSVFLCLIWAGQSVRLIVAGRADHYEATKADFLNFAIVATGTAAYVLAVTYVGFFTSTLALVPLLAFALGYRKITTALVTTVCFIVILYGVFALLLSIPLPPEALFEYLGG